jgi:hypothetical protein
METVLLMQKNLKMLQTQKAKAKKKIEVDAQVLLNF